MLISLRIPDELLAEIDLEAKAEDRSRNSTILRRLRGKHERDERVDVNDQ